MNTRISTRRLPTAGGHNALTWAVAMLGTWRQRQALGQLDDHMLKDIGLTEADVTKESSRPIWDVPTHWLR